MANAAGVLFVKDGQALIVKRSPMAGDEPNKWGLPGGHIEDGETPEQAAAREVAEEIGVSVDPASLRAISDDGHFICHIAPWPEGGEVSLNDEHIGHQWIRAHDIEGVSDLHPGLVEMFSRPSTSRLFQLGQTETDVMEAMRDGLLPSPQRFANMWLYALRITGTGTAVRKFDDGRAPEVAYRPPEFYLTEGFLKRCNGLPVIVLHPDEPALTSEQFAKRNIGAMALPYIDGDEVWGIARIYDSEIGSLMNSVQLSTSPNAVFLDPSVNNTIVLDDGTPLLIEGNPNLLDHLAICIQGVWDKGGAPSGVKSENLGATQMDEKEREEQARKDAEEQARKDADVAAKKDADEAPAWAKALTDSVSGLHSRMDALEGKASKADNAEVAHVVKADDEQARKDAEDREREEAARKDADAALKERVDGIEENIAPLSDEDADAMADAEHRADSAASAHGMPGHSTRPMLGEKPAAYRLRMARKFQAHSAAYGKVDLGAIQKADTTAFGLAEAAIYADAMAAADRPSEVQAGKLREIVKHDAAGREIRTFVGDPQAAWSPFMQPRRQVTGFNTKKGA